MKLYTFEKDGTARVGAEKNGALVDLSRHFASMLDLIRGGNDALGIARAEVASASASETLPFSSVRLLAPLPRPGKILCSGLNYRSHIEENPGAVFLDDPRFFVKVPSTVIGPGEAIRHPGPEFLVDYEVELGVVIGKTMYRPRQSDVMPHVFGYTVFHDVSARFIQFKDKNEDMGKNFDTFSPLGPCIVTSDEIPDPSVLLLRFSLNGEILQEGTSEEWCFGLPRLLAWLSMAMTLDPGDLVTTGTPRGIGYFRNPQIFLKPGDRCVLEIENIGRLENPVEAIVTPPHVELRIDRSIG